MVVILQKEKFKIGKSETKENQDKLYSHCIFSTHIESNSKL